MSPNPSLATRIELIASWNKDDDTYRELIRGFVTHGNTGANCHHHQSHGELPDVKYAAHAGHDRDHPETDDGYPQDGHEEGGGDHVPFAVVGAVGDGPGVEYQVGEGHDKQ